MSKLAAGRYKAKILYHTITENTAGNTEMRIAVLPYADPQFPLPATYKPTPITIFMTITDKTMGTANAPGWVAETLKHLGFHSTDLSLLDPESEVPFSFTGHEITILGSEDSYKGKARVRFNILRNQLESRPVGADRLRALSDKYKDVLEANLANSSLAQEDNDFDPKKLDAQSDGPYAERR